MTEHPSGCRDTLHVHRGFRAPGSLIHELSRVSASCVCCAGRCWTVLKSRGRDARLVEPGAPRSEGRKRRGFRQPGSTGTAALNATPPPMLRARPSRSAPNPRWRCGPGLQVLTGTQIPPEPAPAVRPLVHDGAHATSSTPPQPGPLRSGPALVSARRSEGARCPKRSRSAPGTMQRDTEAHRKHAENTRPSHGFLETPTPPRL